MATAQRMSVDESHCVLCWEDIEYSACGSCDHPICLKCCVKLRLLRKQFDCPVCRAQLKEVIVSKGYKSWAEKSARPRRQLHVRSFGIVHETRESQAKVDEFLEHRCQECNELFKSFPQVKDHVRKVHALMYCDICLRHLKIFTHERKCYTKEALVKHRKEGDPDDRSHRGHPLCQFCDYRYFDNDELLVHLRKNHFWCHLCEKDGSQDYYPDYKDLRKHFKQAHFLCEEGECVHEKFTSVFRMKVDYQAHIAQKHSARLSKAEARQMRQLDVNITFARREDSNGFVSAGDYSFPEQGQERYRERSRITSSATGRYPEPRDFERQRGRENLPQKEAQRRGVQDVKTRSNVHKGRQTDVGVNDPEDRRGAGRSNTRSPRNVLESDHKHPPGVLQSESDKARILEGGSRNSKVNNDEKKSGNGGKAARESDKVSTKKVDSDKKGVPGERLGSGKEKQKKLDDGSLSGKVKKAKTKVQESDKGSSEEKAHDKSKPKNSNLSQEGNVDTSVAQRTQAFSQENTCSSLSPAVVDPAPKLEEDFPALPADKEHRLVANIAKPKPTYDSEFPSLSNEPNKIPESIRPPPGFSSELVTPNPYQDGKQANFGPKFSDLYNPNTKSKKPKEQMADPGKSLAKSLPKTNVPNKPAAKPSYDSEFPTLDALTNGHKTSSNVRTPPGLAPPGFQPVASVRPPPGMGWSVPLSVGALSARETRSEKLISDIRRILNFRGESFQRFQQVSSFYRQGKSTPSEYYQECCSIFGEDDIHKVFPGFIDLLPDEDKQKQLLLVYNDAKVTAKLGEASGGTGVDVGLNAEGVEAIETAKSESVDRSISRPVLEDDFPALPNAAGKKNKSSGKASNAWTRGK